MKKLDTSGKVVRKQVDDSKSYDILCIEYN